MFKTASLTVLLLALHLLAVAQDKTTKEDTKKPDEAPAPLIVKTTLSRYFKQLASTEQQKKAVYKVRAAYAAKIAKLNEEIAALRLKEKEDTEAVLTIAQKSRLKELQSK